MCRTATFGKDHRQQQTWYSVGTSRCISRYTYTHTNIYTCIHMSRRGNCVGVRRMFSKVRIAVSDCPGQISACCAREIARAGGCVSTDNVKSECVRVQASCRGLVYIASPCPRNKYESRAAQLLNSIHDSWTSFVLSLRDPQGKIARYDRLKLHGI